MNFFLPVRYFGGDEAQKKHMYTFWHGRLAEFFEHCEDFDRKSEVSSIMCLDFDFR